ncbi:MAG: hypothetical protein ACRBB4_15500, partial [Neptuniibacter sp.]
MFKKLKSMFGSSEENTEQKVPEQGLENPVKDNSEAEVTAEIAEEKPEIQETETDATQIVESAATESAEVQEVPEPSKPETLEEPEP